MIVRTCQGILDARGFLVIASLREKRIGECIPDFYMVDDSEKRIQSPICVVSETNGEDFAYQAKLMGETRNGYPSGHFFYRVIAE